MKILHLNGEREDFGGVTTVLRNLTTASRPLGWENMVWVNREYVEKRQPALNYRYSKYICSDSPNHLRILFGAVMAFTELSQLLRREQFDIIHAHSRGALLVGLAVAGWLKRPVVFTNHNYARRLGLYRWAAQQRNLRTVLLTPNMAKHYGLESAPPRVSIISACCADRLFDEPLVSRRAQTDQQLLQLVGVGVITARKRWHLVVQALMQLAETERNRVEFSLWGPTPDDPQARQYESDLRQSIKRNRLERQFLIRGPMTSLAAALRTADWMVHPATNEPCSVAIMEALAFGLPVVASASGGVVDMIQPGKNGLWFEPDNPKLLADHLRRILRQRVEIAPPAEIRESVRHRSASWVVNDYRKLYEDLLSSAGER